MDLDTRGKVLASLIDAATLAASGDNTQPWQFRIDADAGRVSFYVDPNRDPSPMNSGQRMARIAVGAALENALRTAEEQGCQVDLENPAADALVQLRLERVPPSEFRRPQVLCDRVTNRRPYSGKPIPSELLHRLQQQTPPMDGVVTHWICERPKIESLAGLIGRADAAMFGDPSMRQAFLSKVRFDAPANETVSDGLPTGSLELDAAGRFALPLMSRIPHWLFRALGASKVFSTVAGKLVKSASGLCLITAPDANQATDVNVGRCMQRAWLAITEAGLAAQPMMSLMVLDNLLEHGLEEQIEAIGRSRLVGFRTELHESLPELGSDRPAFLLRFGYAPNPTARTGRLPLKEVMNRSTPHQSVSSV